MWIISKIKDLKNQDKIINCAFFNLNYRQEVPKPSKKKADMFPRRLFCFICVYF